jgi:hypothetical protein
MYPGGPQQGLGGANRAVIDSGIARPSGPPLPNSTPVRPDQPMLTRDAPGTGRFDAGAWQPPEGHAIDHAMLKEFETAAGELGLDSGQAERLLELHHRATGGDRQRLESMLNEWYMATQREFGDQLPRVVAGIQYAVGSDHDAAEFFRLLNWSGIEHNPSVLRILHKLATARRY